MPPPPTSDMLARIESPTLRRFYGYYRQKSGSRPFPARADLDPLDFPYALGDVTLVDVRHDPLRFHFRLDGTRHVERFGFDMTGRTLDDFPYPEMRQKIFDSYCDVVEHRRPAQYYRDLQADGRWFRYEALLLPLSADGATVDMLMSVISFHDLKIPLPDRLPPSA
jgi:hypothetical protein